MTMILDGSLGITLPVPLNTANGGTGLTTLTANNVVLGNGINNVILVAPGTTGNVLTSNNGTWVSQATASVTASSTTSIGLVRAIATNVILP